MQYHPNLNAYSGVEDLSNFTPEQFSAYCKVKLGECGKHIDFIKKNILSILPKPKRLTIAEIGSGNSKLLYRLELENLLTSAIGFELSESRHEFAEKFGIHVNAQKTKNVCASFLDYPPPPLDLVIGVDIVLQLVAPVSQGSEKSALKWMKDSIKPEGFLLLELWSFENIINQLDACNGNLKIWEEYQIDDPWEFCLANITRMKNNDIKWDKTFLKRGSTQKSSFTNILRPYSQKAIKQKLMENGFTRIKFFNYWSQPGDCSEGEYIVLAQ